MQIKYVCGFVYSIDGSRVVLLERSKDDWQQGFYNGIGGKINKGEEPVNAMVREFEEEAGISTGAERWTRTIVLSGPEFEVHFFANRSAFLAARFEKAYKCNEGIIRTFSTAAVPHIKVIPNLRWIVPMQLDNLAWPINVIDLYEEESEHVS